MKTTERILNGNVKTKKDFTKFLNMLVGMVKDNKAISENAMLDGFIIGLIHSNSGFVCSLLTSESQLPPSSDNTIQQLEQCIIWICNNEYELCKLLNLQL